MPAEAHWLNPQVEQQGLGRYVTTLRERWWLVLLSLVVCVGFALAYVATAEKTYEVSADVLVTPVSGGDESYTGLGLIVESNDPTQAVSTASRYIESRPVAERVKRELRLPERAAALMERVVAEPLAQSSVVTVTATAPDAREAADLANAFAREAVRLRTAQLREQLNLTIPRLRQRLETLPPAERTADNRLVIRLDSLEYLRTVPDPTIRVVTPASPPERQASPRPVLSLAAGIISGLILGIGGAFALQAFDPRLRREEQLRSLYRLPILARIPLEKRSRKDGAIAPERLSVGTAEAFRTLRASLAATLGSDFRAGSVLVTGSSPGEGKTTTAINLAHSLVAAGNRVILIEADVHRPTIGAALGVRPQFGLSAVLIRQVALQDALITTERYGPDLQLLLVDRAGSATADRLSLPTASQLIAEAEELADFVVVDSPPLTAVVDALPLAQQVAGVLIVARLGRTKLNKLAELGEILSQNDLKPAGVALVGVERSRTDHYYATPEPQTRRGAAAAVSS